MNLAFRQRGKRGRGGVAVECAIILPIFIGMTAALLLFGRVLWHYTVVQKAAHDAARFLATTSYQEMKPSSGGAEVPAALIAQSIARQELTDLAPGGGIDVVVQCQTGSSQFWGRCNGFDIPKKVLVYVEVTVTDPFFDAYTYFFNYGQPIYFKAMMATDYVGN
ncbi:TadE family protein [Massilia sp. YIM B02443]|uniref:TadE family protein n=1 Tax=Massilia sp. YIM B02443 TaxID=3050127 RepID=UPI0025B6C0AB|nr:TadE family protein [Massilia sp. YIM B02443]MDN4037648.1 pilus assembly protein [Massilia sp. YIM B02443]